MATKLCACATKNDHAFKTNTLTKQWRPILTFVEVSLELLLDLLCEKHSGSISEMAHYVPQQNRFM